MVTLAWSPSHLGSDLLSRGQCCKTLYGHNLRIFVISQISPCKPFQLSLMFVSKARSLPQSGAPERCFTSGRLSRDRHSDLFFKWSTLEQAPGLTHKYQTRLERLASDKRPSILLSLIWQMCLIPTVILTFKASLYYLVQILDLAEMSFQGQSLQPIFPEFQ